MTWLLPNTDLLYIHIPKCGGTSIHKSLRRCAIDLDVPRFPQATLETVWPVGVMKKTPPHIKVSEYLALGYDLSQHHVFTQVRDPYTRLVSVFYFFKRQDKARVHGRNTQLKADIEFYKKRYSMFKHMTFEEFVKSFLDKEQQPLLLDKWIVESTSQLVYGLTPQHMWTDGHPVQIFKMEKAQRAVKFIERKMGRKFFYRHMKWQRIQDYMGHYTDETRELVYEYYKQDFVKFDYAA